MDNLSDRIEAFAKCNVLVLGDAMLDGYWEGSCCRVCPEAPVPVVNLCQSRCVPGGAANTAANARALGADVTLLGVVGDDAEANELTTVLRGSGVSAGTLTVQPGRRTLAKRRVMAAGQVICRLDQGDTAPADSAAEANLLGSLAAAWPRADAVVVSDYGYGVLTPAVIAALAELQQTQPRVIVADSKRLTAFHRVGLTAVKPNFAEAIRLLDLDPVTDPSRAELIASRGARILELTGARIASITLDTEGAIIFERGRPTYRTYAEPQPYSRAGGAGDSYAAALALALASGGDMPASAELAAAAAAVVVGKDGTACCTANELRARLAGGQKVTDRAGAIDRVAEERKHGRRVVLTNGCFDILHRGHVTYLARAKALGDWLVVGVNTDAGIRRLKGPARPINTLEDRVHVLAALSCVDLVVPFDEETPHNLIRAVRPDVFVKGGDYTRDRLPEAGLVEALGGEVSILPFFANRSTTSLIEKIRSDQLAAVGGGAS